MSPVRADRTRDASPPARTTISRAVPAVAVAAALVATWQMYVAVSGVRPQVLPSPARVVEQGWQYRDALTSNAWATLQVTFVGFALSLACAWALAIAVDFSPRLRTAFVPLFVVSQTLPIVAIAPLMIIWFGFGLLPKVLVVALVTFFPMAIGLVEGFASAPRDSSALLRSMGASRWQQFRYVRLPSALPRFFTSLRIGITYAVVGAVFAEYVGASEGLGIFMSIQKNSFRTDLVLAAVAVTAAVSVALYVSTFAVERAVAPWISEEGVR
ncbi:ABC transporter permease [Rhodococcus sp. HNM0569]|uniref:ABC transporter permease n=1 Tax=Rhodococcus sp. HNM0569 TaxID=2716340 RepID=UPI00146BE870|nr:ABC transporter permease [Rhodococcus sp. HNM0569]NLU84407.1 ABC transporter permease [Rhodococcus sp. HNM0569]